MSGTPIDLATKGSQSVDPNRLLRIQRAEEYPEQIWFFLASFIGLLTLIHFGALLLFWLRKRRASRTVSPGTGQRVTSGEEAAKPNANRTISLRRIPLAIVNAFRIFAFRITIPIGGGNVLNGAEILITVGYIVALFTWEFINCLNLTTRVKLDVSYWANRAGNIVATQLPLMVALAGKNNIISLLTGVSYEKLNVLHRAAARVNLVLVWVHFWGRVQQGLTASTAIYNPWVRVGIMAATAYTLLVLLSFRPLRTKFYEFFFYSHFILVLMILIGTYYHLHSGFGFGPYLIPSFVLWALDRFLRAVRVLWNNRPISRLSRESRSASLDAIAEVLSPTMVRLVLTRDMTWRAGQNAFITMPGVSRIPFEAHPFTIASIPQHGTSMKAGSAESSSEDVEKGGKETKGNELVFLIRVKEGFTKRLREAAERKGGEGGGVSLSVYVDGPYGSPPDVNAFEKVVLIAGGSGVSYTLPLLQAIVHAQQGKTACRNVFFLWVVTHRTDISWVSRALRDILETAPGSLQICLRVHVTRSVYSEDNSSGDVSSDTKENLDSDAVVAEKLLQDHGMRIELGRPDVRSILEEELVDATGSVSVNVAGPADLARDVRNVLSSGSAGPTAVLKGGPDVTLHMETYGIAVSGNSYYIWK